MKSNPIYSLFFLEKDFHLFTLRCTLAEFEEPFPSSVAFSKTVGQRIF